jgi:hypothetical protein
MIYHSKRRLSAYPQRAAVALVIASGLAATATGERLSLQAAVFSSGTRLTGSGTAEILSWEPSGTLTRWQVSGQRLGVIANVGIAPHDGAPFAARGGRALLCVGEGGGVRCRVLDTTSGRPLASFSWDRYPVRAWPAAEGWLLSTAPPAGVPEVRLWSDDGSFRPLPLPAEELAALAKRLGVEVAAVSPRLFAVGRQVWAIPAGRYEFWRLEPPGGTPIAPPPCRAVEGHHYRGEEARQRRGEFFSCNLGSTGRGIDPFAEVEAMRRTLAVPTGTGGFAANATLFIGAVGRVAVSGTRVAVRVDAAGQGGKRATVDVWEFEPSPRLVAEAELPSGGWNPLEVTATTVWVACRQRVHELPLNHFGATHAGSVHEKPRKEIRHEKQGRLVGCPNTPSARLDPGLVGTHPGLGSTR